MGRSGLGEALGIRADLATFGKHLGASFASGGRADLLAHLDPTRPGALPHAGTFDNDVFTMGAGLVALTEVVTPERAERLRADGEALRARLDRLCDLVEGGVQFTGCGSVLNVHFTGRPVTCPEDLASEPRGLFALFHLDLLEAGVYAARRGQINLSPPMTGADSDRIVAAVDGFLRRRRALVLAQC